MNPVILFIIALCASTIGAITGIGGGVIVKPVVDILNILPVSTTSFLSGCMVLSMSLVSLWRNRKSKIKVDTVYLTPLAIGAALGGVAGNLTFNAIKEKVNQDTLIVFLQSLLLMILVLGVYIYMLNKEKIKTFQVKNLFLIVCVGLMLGFFSAFLGIGGGPINLVVLYILFSMDVKTASVSSLFVIAFSQTASLLLTLFKNNIPDFDPLCLVLMIVGGIVGGITGSAILKKISNEGVTGIFKSLLVAIILICCVNMWRCW